MARAIIAAGSEVLGLVTVPASSELIFGENATSGVALAATGIVVNGALRAGSASCRLTTRVTITLHGTRPSTRAGLDALPTSAKGVVVGGTLELHGALFYSTWTRLARAVRPGDTSVLLQRAVNWRAGQQVVLTTTALKDSRDFHRNEVLTLASDVPSTSAQAGAELQLSSPAVYSHEANDAWQGEVGLLSRNIVVQGAADDSEPTDVSPISCDDPDHWVLSSHSRPCSNHLTGYGAHIRAEGGAIARVSGVEFRRVGQTNLLGRYPIHFHLMGDVSAASSSDGARRAYVRDSSIHRSYYRCVSVHGTSHALVSMNVAYDAIGHCYYLEDGIEEENIIEYNLAAHVHFIGTPARASGQRCADVEQSDDLLLPADVTASGFYVTNANNQLVGNAASGGWAGFAFPTLPAPIKDHRAVAVDPSSKTVLRFEGNSAHSSGFWWHSAGQIYVGGKLWHPSPDAPTLRYNPCRTQPGRSGRTVLRETKVFLGRGVGVSHWGSYPELLGLEAHDLGLAASILGDGWVDRMLVRCRSGAPLVPPCDPCDADAALSGMLGSGFEWYDTNQAHIITNATFRNCGVRTAAHSAAADGCGDGARGCAAESSVWALLAHSDEHVPEFMQATKDIRYEDCGKRFRFDDFVADSGRSLNNGMASTLSGRIASWLDADGSASELQPAPILLGSALPEAGEWWRLDPQCVYRSEAPTWHCAQRGARQLGSVNLQWLPSSLQLNTFGVSTCGNGQVGLPCVPHAHLAHWGAQAYGRGGGYDHRLPLTLNGETAGALGGHGWHLRFLAGGPRVLNISRIQVPHDTKLLLSIAYPTSVDSVSVTAYAAPWCWDYASPSRLCVEGFSRVGSIAAVRASLGNTYHLANGVLTIRVVQPPKSWTGRPTWTVPVDPVAPFERDGVRIPRYAWHPVLSIVANCAPSASNAHFCAGALPADSPPAPCATGFAPTAYDQCCSSSGYCVDPEGQEGAACSCSYTWVEGCAEPNGVELHCEPAR